MDLILRDTGFYKSKVIKRPSYSCSTGLYGASKNDFELILTEETELLPIGHFLTYGTTEFGGCILERIVSTEDKTVKYIGKTFRGQMENSIVNPYSAITVSGTDDEVLSYLFLLSQLNYKINPTSRTTKKQIILPRGTNLLKAADIAMATFGEKMIFKVSNDGVEISLMTAITEKYDASQVDLIADENRMLPTALHVAGYLNYEYGDETIQIPIHVSVYVQQDGSIGNNRFYTGFSAVEIWQEEKSAVDNSYELEVIAMDKLKALRESHNTSEVKAKLENSDIGDKVHVTIQEFGVKAVQTVSEKVLKFDGRNEEITYNTGG